MNAETETLLLGGDGELSPFDPAKIPALVAEGYDLCTTGKALALACELHGQAAMEDHYRCFRVFARMMQTHVSSPWLR